MPLSIDQNQRCLPGAGTWLPPSPWRCSSTFPELLKCSHLCHQISGEGELFSLGPEQPELGKVTFHINRLICIYCCLHKLISFGSFPKGSSLSLYLIPIPRPPLRVSIIYQVLHFNIILGRPAREVAQYDHKKK